jgi:nicotinamide mononucleotide transporter
MWQMALKKIENWIAWIVGDLICVPLFASKGLILTSFQFTIFLILAILGYTEWMNKIRLNSKLKIRN